jgi:hypothetical protein
MKQRFPLACVVIMTASFAVSAQKAKYIPNPSIDMKAFLKIAEKAAEHRESRRLTEEEFIRMSKEPGVVILDARSRQKFDELHIRGAVNRVSRTSLSTVSRRGFRIRIKRSSSTATTTS